MSAMSNSAAQVPGAPASAPPLSPERYERLLPFVRANYDAHDKTCVSMRYFWLGSRGGVSCFSDLADCDGCGHTFLNEGVAWVNWEVADTDEDEVRLCACCATSAGYEVRMGEYGLTTSAPTRPGPTAQVLSPAERP
jgi:hypothetical protein